MITKFNDKRTKKNEKVFLLNAPKMKNCSHKKIDDMNFFSQVAREKIDPCYYILKKPVNHVNTCEMCLLFLFLKKNAKNAE
jgi:hypothetical protein